MEHHTFPAEVLAQQIAEHPGQSFYLIDEQVLRYRVRTFQTLFLPEHPHRHIAYAVKANPDLVPLLHQAGLSDFDCASAEEVDFVRRETGTESWISFNNPCALGRHSVRQAAEAGVTTFTADNAGDLDVILAASQGIIDRTRLQISIRLATESRHSGINLSDKFGCTPEKAKRLIARVHDAKAEAGLAIHPGSQTLDPQIFRHEIKRLGNLAQELSSLTHINLGGGIPVPSADTPKGLEDYLEVISESLRESLGILLQDDTALILEPGRSMVADAVSLVVPIRRVLKRSDKVEIRIADGIFGSFGDAAIHDWNYPFELINAQGKKITGPQESFRLQGQTCDSGDMIESVQLPAQLRDLQEQNLESRYFLLAQNAGAFLRSKTSQFQNFPPHPSIILPASED